MPQGSLVAKNGMLLSSLPVLGPIGTAKNIASLDPNVYIYTYIYVYH